jgi:multicomponent Na+:H+ antiporter subunit G
MLDLVAMALITLGAAFFVAGTVGLLRFPDLFCRLHALTKADGLGLALIALGVALMAQNAADILRIVLVWFFLAGASATCGHLIARYARRSGMEARND